MDLEEFSSTSAEQIDEMLDATAYDIIMNMPTHSLIDLANTVVSRAIATLPIDQQHQLVTAPLDELYNLFYDFLLGQLKEPKENLIGSKENTVSS